MALCKKLALTGVFAAVAAVGIYAVAPRQPEPLDPQVARAETDLILWRQGLTGINLRSRSNDGFCLDVITRSSDIPMEACFKDNTGHVKLDSLKRK